MAGRQIVVDIIGDASKFTRATKEATGSATKLGNLFGQGLGLGAGISAMNLLGNAASDAATQVVDFAKGSIDAASNLNETVTKSRTIFGDGASAVEDWAKRAGKSMGLSERAALDAASGFAGLFKTVGIGLTEATAMSKDITQLGSDLASFFNTDMETALAALKSGLSGESEPLRKFNVFLSETAVSAKLAQMGIKKVGGQFTESQKATARYQLIMEQTADAQGDFARTSDGLANTQRQLAADVENLQAELGEALLPAMVELAHVARDDIVPALRDVISLVKDNADTFALLGDVITAVVQGPGQVSMNNWKEQQETMADATQVAAAEAAMAWDTGSERIGMAFKAASDASDDAKDNIVSDARKMRQTYAELADYLLGKYNDDYDKALGIQEARSDLHNAKNAEDRVEAYAELERLGELSQKDYDNWITQLKAMAKGTKGQVHDAFMAAIADVNALRNAARKPITIAVNYRSTGNQGGFGGKAGGGAASGLTWVGEQGPELVNLPTGSFVHNNADSRRMASGGGSVNIVLQSPVITPGSAEAIAAAVGPYLTRSMQRTQVLGR